MAGVIMATLKKRKERADEVQKLANSDDLDANNNGRLDQSEIKAAMPRLIVRADVMLQRLELERDLLVMITKLPVFVCCLTCFILALLELNPSSSVYNAHRHIVAEFGLEKAGSVTSIEGIYTYMSSFNDANKKLQATSQKYWCETRYTDVQWDHTLHIPTKICHSPRQYSLGFSTNSYDSWQEYTAREAACPAAPAPAPHDAGESSGGHRLLAGSSSSSTSSSSGSGTSSSASSSDHGNLGRCSGDRHVQSSHAEGSTTAHALADDLPCVDDNAALQMMSWTAELAALNATDPSAVPPVTCEVMKAEVCHNDYGIRFCRKTCGLCGPWTYEHLEKFIKPQVTMLPVMIYQTRFAKDDCHGYAQRYQDQDWNPVLTLLPGLDGKRHGRVLQCIDRSKTSEDEYAHHIECPKGSPLHFCGTNGIMHGTRRKYFHGDAVYPRFLTAPSRDIPAMKAHQWIDLQSGTVTLSTLVYTEGMEVFTSVSVVFSLDEAGNVDGQYSLLSYRDLHKGSKNRFIVALIVCMGGSLIGVIMAVQTMMNSEATSPSGFGMYEFFARALLFAYPLALLLSWATQASMGDEYDELLHSFLNIRSISEDDSEKAIEDYFDVKSHIYAETSWLQRHKVTANIVLYIQFMQLIFYFSAHPKMAVLTDTVFKALDNIWHFLLIFSVLFFMLAFMAHWMLGEYIPDFGTYPDAISAQGRMIFGEFIYAAGAEKLTGVIMAMYWVYAFTFMIVIFFTLLNFFLAIIVDAFADVKAENSEKVVVSGFFTDLWSVVTTVIASRAMKWPTTNALIKHFEDAVERQTKKIDFMDMLQEQAQDDDEDDVAIDRLPLDGGTAATNERKASPRRLQGDSSPKLSPRSGLTPRPGLTPRSVTSGGLFGQRRMPTAAEEVEKFPISTPEELLEAFAPQGRFTSAELAFVPQPPRTVMEMIGGVFWRRSSKDGIANEDDLVEFLHLYARKTLLVLARRSGTPSVKISRKKSLTKAKDEELGSILVESQTEVKDPSIPPLRLMKSPRVVVPADSEPIPDVEDHPHRPNEIDGEVKF